MKHCAKLVVAVVALVAWANSSQAQSYTVDLVHSSLLFQSKHAGIGHVWGRFDSFGGSFTLDDADVGKTTFSIEVKAGSVNSGNEKRDGHLKTPDFLNAKQFPTISFKSTGAKKGADGKIEVTGDLTLHGVTKPITASVEVIGRGEFPKDTPRAGLEATLVVKTSDFGIKGVGPAVGDEIKLIVALEGTGK